MEKIRILYYTNDRGNAHNLMKAVETIGIFGEIKIVGDAYRFSATIKKPDISHNLEKYA